MEQLVRAVVVLCCGASSVYNTDEDGHSNGVTSASIQAARTAVLGAGRRKSSSSLWHRGTRNPKFSSPAAGHHLIRCFRIHSSFARLYPSLPRRLEVLIYAQIYVLRALDGEVFFASGGAARRGAREGLSSMSARRLHLFENFTRRSPQADNNKSI